jgi:hypothetical protein
MTFKYSSFPSILDSLPQAERGFGRVFHGNAGGLGQEQLGRLLLVPAPTRKFLNNNFVGLAQGSMLWSQFSAIFAKKFLHLSGEVFRVFSH